VESPVLGDGHAGFGGRAGETHREQSRQGAPVRPINLYEAALSEVKAHSACWATVLDAPIYDGPRTQTTLERWHQVHHLLDQGVGLLECARRLQLALNTVKRYARADRPERMLRVQSHLANSTELPEVAVGVRPGHGPTAPVGRASVPPSAATRSVAGSPTRRAGHGFRTELPRSVPGR
jgi:hypothetical protein